MLLPVPTLWLGGDDDDADDDASAIAVDFTMILNFTRFYF